MPHTLRLNNITVWCNFGLRGRTTEWLHFQHISPYGTQTLFSCICHVYNSQFVPADVVVVALDTAV